MNWFECGKCIDRNIYTENIRSRVERVEKERDMFMQKYELLYMEHKTCKIDHQHIDACRYGCKITLEEMAPPQRIKELSIRLAELEMKLKDKDIEINELYDQLIHIKKLYMEKI